MSTASYLTTAIIGVIIGVYGLTVLALALARNGRREHALQDRLIRRREPGCGP